jgi:3-phenylpropionate/cinnamic acid dioxygenase small subunit
VTDIASDVLRKIDELQARYIDALDSKAMDLWLAAFDAQGSYVCRTAESEEANLPVSLILDDCRERLEDRVKFITQVWAGTYQDYRTRHIVQRIACRREGPDLYAVRSNFIVTYTSKDAGRSELFSSGVYLDQVVIEAGNALFRSKIAITDVPILPHYMVYPL